MIRAIIFDFNGVIIDDEPVHFQLFQKVLREEGIALSSEDYYQNFLGMDDYGCIRAAAKAVGKVIPNDRVEALVQSKARDYEACMQENPPIVAGVLDAIRKWSETHYLAIVSGALREEVEMILSGAGVREYFDVVLGAQDVEKGKPDPEGYLKGLLLLNRDYVASSERLLPQECLVIEDSVWGLQAATAAGMPCIGILTSYKPEDLVGTKLCFDDFVGIDDAFLSDENFASLEGE